MKPNLLALIFTLSVLAHAGIAAAPDKAAKPSDKAEERIAQLHRFLADTSIETKGFPHRMSLLQFLAAVEGQLPPEKKISLRLDKDALGEECAAIAEAEVKSPIGSGKMTLDSALGSVLSQVSKKVAVDYAIRSNGVVITRPRLTAHRMVYDARNVAEQMPQLLPIWRKLVGDIFQDLKPTDGPALLVRLLMNSAEMRPWETVEVLNGGRLAVRASPGRHLEIDSLLHALRRQSDVAVVMNARLYEVDRAFFTKRVAPLFAGDKDAEERPAIVAIDGPLLKRITRQKLLLESEDVRLRPRQKATFLSRHSVFRFAAGRRPGEGERARIGTGLAGVSFEVRPLVSPDRRYLRLRISQNVAQFAGIGKTKALDVATGEMVEVEAPNLRKTSRVGTVTIPDGNPIVIPVDYQPPGAENKDKVWLLVARPLIWIDEEMKEMRNGGGNVTPPSIWDADVQKEEKVVPAATLPLNDEVKEILQAVIADVLTNPHLKDSRDSYGTAKDKTFTLADSEKLGWPKQFQPETHGNKLTRLRLRPTRCKQEGFGRADAGYA